MGFRGWTPFWPEGATRRSVSGREKRASATGQTSAAFRLAVKTAWLNNPTHRHVSSNHPNHRHAHASRPNLRNAGANRRCSPLRRTGRASHGRDSRASRSIRANLHHHGTNVRTTASGSMFPGSNLRARSKLGPFAGLTERARARPQEWGWRYILASSIVLLFEAQPTLILVAQPRLATSCDCAVMHTEMA